MNCKECKSEIDLQNELERRTFIKTRHCWSCKFWLEQFSYPGGMIIDGHHYRAGRDDEHPSLRGCAGRTFAIEDLATGERITTNNLWHQGEVPDHFAKKNTHRMVKLT